MYQNRYELYTFYDGSAWYLPAGAALAPGALCSDRRLTASLDGYNTIYSAHAEYRPACWFASPLGRNNFRPLLECGRGIWAMGERVSGAGPWVGF